MTFFYSDNLISQLERSAFFDDTVRKDMFFLTVHDAVLYIRNRMTYSDKQDPIFEKVRISSSMFPFLLSSSIRSWNFHYSMACLETRHKAVVQKSESLVNWAASVVCKYFARSKEGSVDPRILIVKRTQETEHTENTYILRHIF